MYVKKNNYIEAQKDDNKSMVSKNVNNTNCKKSPKSLKLYNYQKDGNSSSSSSHNPHSISNKSSLLKSILPNHNIPNGNSINYNQKSMSHHHHSNLKLKQQQRTGKHPSSSLSSSSIRSSNHYSHYHNNHHLYKYHPKKIVKNNEQFQNARCSLLEKEKIVKKLKDPKYKIPKNPSASSSAVLTGNSPSSSKSPRKESKSTKPESTSTSYCTNNVDTTSNKAINNVQQKNLKRSKAFILAQQFVENNEKLYPELKSNPNTVKAEIEALTTHFNATQWSLEDRLSVIVQQVADLKSEGQAFSSWYKEKQKTRHRATFHSFQKYYKKLRNQERTNYGSVSSCSSFNSISFEKRHFYQMKLQIKNVSEVLSSTFPDVSSSINNNDVDSKYLVSKNYNPSSSETNSEDDNDDSTNWELVSLEHAFNAFPSTFQTTKPIVKQMKMEDEISSHHTTEKLQKTSALKKKSKKIRKKNRSQRAQQQASQNDQYVSLFSMEKWDKFNAFIMKTAFVIEKRNYEQLQYYLQIVINIEEFFKQTKIESQPVFINAQAIKFEAPDPEDIISGVLPTKRRRRSSSKALEYDCHLQKSKRSRVNGTTRSPSKSPPPPSPAQHKQLSPTSIHMPLMTRAQSKYFFETVLKCIKCLLLGISFTCKNINEIQNHLLEFIVSMKSLQSLVLDIKERQPILQILKVFKEFFNFKFKTPQNQVPSYPTLKRNRIFNVRRRRKRISQTDNQNKSSQKNKQQIPATSITFKSESTIPFCHGIECSSKFDIPTIDQMDMESNCTYANNWNEDDIYEGYLNETLELIAETDAIFKSCTFFMNSLSNTSDFESSEILSTPLKSQNSNNNKSGRIVSPSKCEMKLRSRSSSSSSCQELIPPSCSFDDQIDQVFNNSNLFKCFVEIDISNDESYAKMKIKRAKGKRMNKTKEKKTSRKAFKGESNSQLKFLSVMVEQVDNNLRIISSMNASKIKQICDMFQKELELQELEKEMEEMDFKIMDLYHQYLHLDKKFDDDELNSCLEKLEEHHYMNKKFMTDSIRIMAAAPNSTRMCWTFCQRSCLVDLMESMVGRTQRSIYRDLFEAIAIAVRDSISDESYQNLLILGQKINWVHLDGNKCNASDRSFIEYTDDQQKCFQESEMED